MATEVSFSVGGYRIMITVQCTPKPYSNYQGPYTLCSGYTLQPSSREARAMATQEIYAQAYARTSVEGICCGDISLRRFTVDGLHLATDYIVGLERNAVELDERFGALQLP